MWEDVRCQLQVPSKLSGARVCISSYPAYSARTGYRMTSPVPPQHLVPGDVVMTTLPGPDYLLPPSRLVCSV